MLISILAPIIVFGVIVLVHEGGHFVTAKLTGMKVEEFAVGIGPRIWSWRMGETVYSVRLFPLGGFNRIMGMDPDESGDPRAFCKRPVWQKLVVVSAGSFMNILLAFLIFCGIFMTTGIQTFPNRPEIGQVMADSPAQAAGLLKGDKIISVDSTAIAEWTDLAKTWGDKPGRLISLTVERGGETHVATVIPRDNGEGRSIIGVTPALDTHPVGPVEAIILGADRSWAIVKAVFGGMAAAMTGESANVSGPIGVARLAGTAAGVGAVPFFLLIAVLSLNLGILNLFPIPLLDGGILFLTIGEALFRRRLSKSVLYYIQAVGMAILCGLFLLATAQDLSALMK